MSYAEAQYTLDEVNNVTGIPPMQVSGAKVQVKNGNTYISFTAPDSVLDGHTICYVDKVVIVRKVDSAPTSINDGTVVATIDREHFGEAYEITEYSEIAYYAFFTISDHGVVNEEPVVKQTSVLMYKFAYHQDFTELDPDKTITYLNWGDFVSNSSPMHTNETTGTATYGDFEGFFILKENKPYMVKSDFTADYALDPDDYTKKLDGTASDVSNTSYSGRGAFAWIPKFYMKEVYASDGNSRDVYFSNEQEDEDFIPVGFEDYSIGEVEGLWIPMYYPGSDGKSIAGRTGYGGTTSKTCDQQKTVVDLNGSNARFFGGSIMNALRDLMYGLYKSTNIQEHGGYGNCNGYNSTGASVNYGMTSNPVLSNGAVEGFKGTGNSSDSSSRKQANKAFHSNVLFTYDMRLRDPYTLFYIYSNSRRILLRSTYIYNIDGTGVTYDTVQYVYYTARTNGYSSGLLEPMFISNNAQKQSINYGDGAGSNSTGLCDYDYWGSSSSKTYVADRLGSCGDGLACGPAGLNLSVEASASAWLIGAAVLLIPPADYKPEG